MRARISHDQCIALGQHFTQLARDDSFDPQDPTAPTDNFIQVSLGEIEVTDINVNGAWLHRDGEWGTFREDVA